MGTNFNPVNPRPLNPFEPIGVVHHISIGVTSDGRIVNRLPNSPESERATQEFIAMQANSAAAGLVTDGRAVSPRRSNDQQTSNLAQDRLGN